jgi:exodeoxyribonuclease VII small subunit
VRGQSRRTAINQRFHRITEKTGVDMSIDGAAQSDSSENRASGFEEKIRRLQQITESLEHDEFNLEASLKLYKEGLDLAGECRDELNKARHIVKMYAQDGLREFRSEEAKDEDRLEF